MADKKIEAADTVSNPTGGELIPVAAGQDGARTPGKVSIDTIKNLTLAAIKDIAGLGSGETISADTDFVLTKRAVTGGFEEKHVKLSDIAEIINGLLFLETPIPLDGSFLFTMYGGEENGIFSKPLSDVVDFVRENIGDVPLNISGLTAASDVADADAIPAYQTREGQTAGNKKVTVAQLSAKAFGDIPSKAVDITTATPSSTFDATDCILIDKGGVVKKVQLQNSGLTKGGAKAPVDAETGYISTVTGNIPQWADNSGNLSNGLDVVSIVGPASGTGAATNSNVPTEAAVRTAVDDAKFACAKRPQGVIETDGMIPQWLGGSYGTLKFGKFINESSSSLKDDDRYIPTSKCVFREILRRAKHYPGYIISTSEITGITDAEDGDFLICSVGNETSSKEALFVHTIEGWLWKFIAWLEDDIPTESQELSTLFYGKGSALPTTGSTVKKSQLFILSGNATAGADGLYVAMDDAPDPGWVKLGS